MNKPFQRKGAKSNTHVGREFEMKARDFFAKKGLKLERNVSISIGINGKKNHSFDLGDLESRVLIECKSHTWTEGKNIPSAKITTWNQAMYFFHTAPANYRKIFFVLRDYSPERHKTLAEYYVQINSHLIPKEVEIWEFDEPKNIAKRIK
ncbi:MAG: hypothetical protein HQ575_01055 [Candidatus Omnitrophica bacterium]|nr:hypothetical protein [Candidatus Omnitrophota bacterium]